MLIYDDYYNTWNTPLNDNYDSVTLNVYSTKKGWVDYNDHVVSSTIFSGKDNSWYDFYTIDGYKAQGIQNTFDGYTFVSSYIMPAYYNYSSTDAKPRIDEERNISYLTATDDYQQHMFFRYLCGSSFFDTNVSSFWNIMIIKNKYSIIQEGL